MRLLSMVCFLIAPCMQYGYIYSRQPLSLMAQSKPSVKWATTNSAEKHELNPREQRSAVGSILTVYFVQGAIGLSSLAVSYFLKDELGLSPARGGFLMGIASIPWVIKPVYGLLSDGLPIYGYRRKSYLLISSAIGTTAWALLSTVANNEVAAILCIFVSSLSIAASDVVADSLAAALGRESTSPSNSTGTDKAPSAGDLQSLCKGMYAIGGILSAYFSGSLLETMTPRNIFLITAALPLLTGGAALFLKEPRQPALEGGLPQILTTAKSQITELIKTLKAPAIYMPVLFIFLWQATPSSGATMFYYYTSALGFSPEFLGEVRLASSLAALAGVLAFRWKLKNIPLRSILKWSILLSVPLSLSQVLLTTHLNRQLGIPDQAFTLSDSVVLTALGEISFLPVLVLASSLCPPGGEGALFATLMSIFNGAGILGNELGAALTGLLGISTSNFDNITLLITLCSLTNLLPLLVINRLLPVEERTKAI